MRYTAIVEEPDDTTPVWGCGCQQEGLILRHCLPVEEAVLTPGDPSPCGRCPTCQGLVYPNTLRARIAAYGPELLDAMRKLVAVNEQHNEALHKILGRPPGWKDAYLDAAREVIAKIEGR